MNTVLTQLGEHCRKAIAEGDYSLAISVAYSILKHPELSPFVSIATLTDLGFAQRELGFLHESKDSLEKSLILAENNLGNHSLDVANINLELARLMCLLSEYQVAERHCNTALGILARLPINQSNNPQVIRLHSNAVDCLVGVRRHQGQYRLGLNLIGSELKKLKKNPQFSMEYYQLLNHAGMLHKYMGKLARAKVCYLRALEFHSSLSTLNQKSISDLLYNLGGLNHALNRGSVGALYSYKALKIRRKILGEWHADIALAMSMTAANLIKRNALKRAEILIQHSLIIQHKSYGQSHRDIAMNLNHLGVIYFVNNLLIKAANFFYDAYQMKSLCLAEMHPDLIIPLYNYIMTKIRLGEEAKIKELINKLKELLVCNPTVSILGHEKIFF